MTLLSITLVLLFIMDALGNIASFRHVMQEIPLAQRRRIVLREMGIALVVMLAANFLGETVISLLSLSETTVRMTAGIVLFLVGVAIIFPSVRSVRLSLRPEPEPFVVPLAIPLTAGPSLVATIMLFAHLEPTGITMLMAIFLAWVISTIILFFGEELYGTMGRNGLLACEKLTGMVLVMLAIQRFLEGVQLFVQTFPEIL